MSRHYHPRHIEGMDVAISVLKRDALFTDSTSKSVILPAHMLYMYTQLCYWVRIHIIHVESEPVIGFKGMRDTIRPHHTCSNWIDFVTYNHRQWLHVKKIIH